MVSFISGKSKNSDKVIPNPVAILCNVSTLGAVLIEPFIKYLTVDSGNPDKTESLCIVIFRSLHKDLILFMIVFEYVMPIVPFVVPRKHCLLTSIIHQPRLNYSRYITKKLRKTVDSTHILWDTSGIPRTKSVIGMIIVRKFEMSSKIITEIKQKKQSKNASW